MVHCETTSGIVNPLHDIAAVVKKRSRQLIVDAMCSFGALPIDMAELGVDVMVSSSNKCIEGRARILYVLCRRDMLEASQGPLPFPGARPVRTVGPHGKDRAVPLHAAHPCAGRLRSGAEGT